MFTGDSGYRLKCDKDVQMERKKEKNNQSVQAECLKGSSNQILDYVCIPCRMKCRISFVHKLIVEKKTTTDQSDNEPV